MNTPRSSASRPVSSAEAAKISIGDARNTNIGFVVCAAAKLGSRRDERSENHFFFQAEDGIRVADVTGVQTCALPIFLFPPSTFITKQAIKVIPPQPSPFRQVDNLPTITKGNPLLSEGDCNSNNNKTGDDSKRSEERRVGKEWRLRVVTCA